MSRASLRRGNWSVQELQRLRALLPRRGVGATAILLRRSADSVRNKAVELFGGGARKTAWTAADDFALRQSWGALESGLLAVLLGRTTAEVQKRAAWLRAQLRSGAWSRAEERLLKQLYGTRRDEDLEVCLLRARSEIAAAAARLCLSKDKRFARQTIAAHRHMPRWTAAESAQLAALYPDRDNLEVARLLRRSVASVANKANQLGLKKSPQLLARIGRANVASRYAPAGATATS